MIYSLSKLVVIPIENHEQNVVKQGRYEDTGSFLGEYRQDNGVHTMLTYSLTKFSKWEVKIARARITVITYKYHMVGETLPLYEFYFS